MVEENNTPSPQTHVEGAECQYAQDQGMPERHCAVRCVYEEKGFAAGIEQAARVAERYDETDTLSAPKAIASAIRALAMDAAMTEAYCSEGAADDNLKDCFLHHVRTTIGFLAFGARTGPEMTMYEEGFKAGYRRCQSDNEPELGEEEDALSERARKLVGKLRGSIKAGAVQLADVEDAIDLIIDQSTPSPQTREAGK